MKHLEGLTIRQILPGLGFPADLNNKWYCVVSIEGPDKNPIHRYLKRDGGWQHIADYFDDEGQINEALSKNESPDFSPSAQEIEDREADMRAIRLIYEGPPGLMS